MIPVGTRSLRLLVVGEGEAVDVLSGWDDGTDRSLAVDAIRADGAADGGLANREVDCILVDSGTAGRDSLVLAERCVADRPDVPLVLLVDDWDDEHVADALTAGATEVLPRLLLDADPDRLAERVVSTVEGTHGAASFEELYDNVAGTVAVHDPESGEVVHANRSLCELLGYDREDLLSMQVGEFTADVPGYDQERATNVVSSVRDSDSPLEVEWPLKTADGAVRWVETRLHLVRFGGREVVLSTSIDVTERRRNERKYERIFDDVNDVICVHDPWAEELLDVNETLCDLTGYSRDALLEMDVEGFSATGAGYTGSRAYEMQQRVAATGESETVDWLVETAGGEQRRLESVLSPATIAGEDRVLVLARDVTERRQLEETYRQLFENVSDGLVIHDPESGEILDVNERYCTLTGYDRDELVGSNVRLIVPDDPEYTYDGALARIEEARENGPQLFEFEGQRKDGTTFVGEIHLSTVDIRGDERVLASVRNVTERRELERTYRDVFENVSDGLVVHDPDTGEIRDVNERFCEMNGYDREKLVGETIDLVTGPDHAYEDAQGRIEAARERGSQLFEWRNQRKDGETFPVEVHLSVVDVRGDECVLGSVRDVTEQRRLERRLSEILDRIDEAIFMARADELIDPSPAPDYVSSGYEAIWGHPLQEIQATHENGFFDTLHPDDRAEYQAFVEGIVDDIDDGTVADSYSHEYRIERPDGERRWVHSDYYPTEWNGGAPRIVIVSRDVTDRKARERRIASFDEATDDLATVDTPAEATRTAVDAATETLDLPAVGAFLYDGDDGVLRPEVLAGPLPSEVADEPVGPGDGPLWEGFATGTIVASDGGETETGLIGDGEETPESLSDLEEWRALCLGNHGILLVGSLERPLDAETIQAAHVLAATLEAALNHLQGQQRLAAQEERLRTQTERADRLDRIARLTQQVEAAITDASSPGDIERAVCERLASSGPYDHAWVGGVDVGSDRLSARAVVGASNQYVDGLDLSTTNGSADPHPAVAAWRTDEVQVADSLVGDGPAGNWRRLALSEGYQSICAVPLTYDGITHGVLTLGAASPNSFGDRERDVLSQLGTSIANALMAIERRRALESDETVELEFRGPGENLSFARLADAADCRVQLERTAARQDGSVSVYFGFGGDVPDDATEIASRLLPGSVDVVAEESSAALVEARTDDWFGSPLAEYGGILREATAEPDETTVSVEVPQEADVRSFVERLQSVAPSLDLAATRQHNRQDRSSTELNDEIRAELTDRQFEVLQTALSAGYFEWPRENDGSDVAAHLDITQPTFNKHLRLAEKQTFDILFATDD